MSAAPRPDATPRRTHRPAPECAPRRHQVPRAARINDLAIFQHKRLVGNLQRDAHVLLDQQHGHSLVAHLRHDAKDLLHDQRRQPLRRFVEDQQPRVQQQRARDRQHFLLAAGKLPPAVLLAFRQARKHLIDTLDRPWTRPLDRHVQVLVHREVGEDTPSLRHETNARMPRSGTAASACSPCRRCVTLPVRAGVSPTRLRNVVRSCRRRCDPATS